jgi:hypothetical protein
MIILVADDNALSCELIRKLLEGSGQGIAPHSLTRRAGYKHSQNEFTLVMSPR